MSQATKTKTIKFTIDGQEVIGSFGETIIQVADRHGIYIPRFCYHERLSIAANCRMCLVEINHDQKTKPACHAEITEGMEVRTRSKKTQHAQQSVMEFLLINHPLDCPVCDQGGQCDLQDLAMGFGRGVSRYHESKRAVADENLGSLIQTHMTRCIHCTRCVRFGTEIAGIPELGTIARGEDMRILSYLQQGLKSELSGNVIDICPVGALTSKPTRYNGRSWAFDNHHYVSGHDCLLSLVSVHTQQDSDTHASTIMRVVPRLNEKVNQVWLSDRDRFAFLGLRHPERLDEPMVRDGKNWKVVSWDVALTLVAEKIQSVLKMFGPEQIGALVSPNTSVEEGFICQKLLHMLGCSNMDYRHHQVDTDYLDNTADDRKGDFLDFSMMEQSDITVVVGCDLRVEQPIAAMRLRQAAKQGVKTLSINPEAYDWNIADITHEVVHGCQMIERLAAYVVAIKDLTKAALSDSWCKLLAGIKPSTSVIRRAKRLVSAKGYLLLGQYAQSHEQASTVYQLCAMLEALTPLSIIHLTPGMNATGLSAISFGPSHHFESVKVSTGCSSFKMIDIPRKLYILQQVELEYEHYNPQEALHALEKAETVVAITSFVSERMRQYADILLPAASWSEYSGTWVNVCGEIHTCQAVKSLHKSSKSIWKIYRVLGNLLKLKGFTYNNINELRHDIDLLTHGLTTKNKPKKHDNVNAPSRRNFVASAKKSTLNRVGTIGLYRTDALVRRCDALQAMIPVCKQIKMHPESAAQINCQDGDTVTINQGRNKLTCQLVCDTKIALNAVILPVAEEWSVSMAGRCAEIKVERYNLNEEAQCNN